MKPQRRRRDKSLADALRVVRTAAEVRGLEFILAKGSLDKANHPAAIARGRHAFEPTPQDCQRMLEEYKGTLPPRERSYLDRFIEGRRRNRSYAQIAARIGIDLASLNRVLVMIYDDLRERFYPASLEGPGGQPMSHPKRAIRRRA